MTLFRERLQIACRYGFVIAAGFVLALALLPQQNVPVTTGWDKLNHALAFFVLSALLDMGFVRLKWWPQQLAIMLAYGVLIECLQWLTPDRQFSLLDVVADGVGIVVYAGFALLVLASPRRQWRASA